MAAMIDDCLHIWNGVMEYWDFSGFDNRMWFAGVLLWFCHARIIWEI